MQTAISPDQMSDVQCRSELLRLIWGFRTTRAIHAVVSLGLADRLCSGPKASDVLAVETKTHSGSLYRLMRAMASLGIFREDDRRCFSLTPVGEFLRTDTAGSHAAIAELVGQDNFQGAWNQLLYSVRTGATAFDHVHGYNIWQYRALHLDEARIFDRAMAAGTERFAEAVLDAYDFRQFGTLMDVGGGDGAFLNKVLAAYPHIQGILFDQPHVVVKPAAPANNRYRPVGGNFFNGLPKGADACLLKWILHDWDDTAAIDILRSCRNSMGPSGKVLVVEHVVGAPNSNPDGKLMDLAMMVLTGGRERTAEEFATLFENAGLRLSAIMPTTTPLSVIEGGVIEGNVKESH